MHAVQNIMAMMAMVVIINIFMLVNQAILSHLNMHILVVMEKRYNFIAIRTILPKTRAHTRSAFEFNFRESCADCTVDSIYLFV